MHASNVLNASRSPKTECFGYGSMLSIIEVHNRAIKLIKAYLINIEVFLLLEVYGMCCKKPALKSQPKTVNCHSQDYYKHFFKKSSSTDGQCSKTCMQYNETRLK